MRVMTALRREAWPPRYEMVQGVDSRCGIVLPIAVEDVKREVKILRALTGHENVVMLHNAFEDDTFVYIVNGVSSLIDLLELP
ncbi:calcium-dependent protein kinase 28-like protein [Tanacetum coccineum]